MNVNIVAIGDESSNVFHGPIGRLVIIDSE
jgi:hypothetical protein